MDSVFNNLYSRGLFQAAKFISAFGPFNSLENDFWQPTPHQKQLEIQDTWILNSGLNYLTQKEYYSASKATRYGKSQKAIFIHLYSLYIQGEINLLETKMRNQDTQAVIHSKNSHKEHQETILPSNPITKPSPVPILVQESNPFSHQISFQLSRIVKKDPFLLFLQGLVQTSISNPFHSQSIFIESLNLFPWNWSAWKALKKNINPMSPSFPDFIVPKDSDPLAQSVTQIGPSDIQPQSCTLDQILSGKSFPLQGYKLLSLISQTTPPSSDSSTLEFPNVNIHPEELYRLSPDCSNFLEFFHHLSNHFCVDPIWVGELTKLAKEIRKAEIQSPNIDTIDQEVNQDDSTINSNAINTINQKRQKYFEHLTSKFVFPPSFPFSGKWSNFSIDVKDNTEENTDDILLDVTTKSNLNQNNIYITVYPHLPSIEFLQKHPGFRERFVSPTQSESELLHHSNQRVTSSDELIHNLIDPVRLPHIQIHWLVSLFQVSLLLNRPNNVQVFSLLKPIVKLFPKVAYPLFLVGKCYYSLRMYDDAEKIFHRVEQIDPLFILHYPLLSNIYYTRQNTVLLHALAKKCTTLDKYSPNTCIVLGNYYSSRNNSDKAILFLSRAVKLSPGYSLAWTLLGHELINISAKASALAAYNSAIRADPSDFRPWYAMGYLLEILQKYNFALYHYRRAISLQPHDGRLWNALGNVYETKEDHAQSIQCYLKAWECDPSLYHALLTAANLSKSIKQFDVAASIYKKALPSILSDQESRIDAIEPLRYLATFSNFSSRPKEAKSYSKQLLEVLEVLEQQGIEITQEMTEAKIQATKIQNL